MNIWNVLKIEQTKDKDALKKAYRMRLSSVNPEDDAEGFMELRQAYEEAVRLADIKEEEIVEEDEDTFSSSLLAIYNDFKKRINPDVWQELIYTDAFISLDSREASFNELLCFLMGHVFIPQKIWKLIVREFDIEERKKELAERFPQNFVEYILNNAEYEDIINYDCFDIDEGVDSEQIDSYIRAFYEIDRTMRQHETKKAQELIEQAKSDTIRHPYFKLMELRLSLQDIVKRFDHKKESMSQKEIHETDLEVLFAAEYHDELHSLLETAGQLAEQFPKDITILHFCGDLACSVQDFALGKTYYEQARKIAPENYYVKAKHAELMFRTGNYKEARDTYMELLKDNHYDNNVRIGMIRSNQKLIEDNEKLLAENPDDMTARMEIAWSRYQSYQFQEAVKFLTSFSPEGEQKFEYYNVLGRCYLGISDYEHALRCFLAWRNLIEQLPQEDTSEAVQKKRKRYPYVHFLIGDCYLKLKNYDKARECFQFAMQKQHDEIMLCYEAFCELEYVTGNYTACLKACEKLLEKDSKDYIGYIFRAKACEKLDYIQESIHACDQAISLYPYLPDPYALKVKIYIKANQIAGAKEIIEQADKLNVESDNIDYERARLLFLDQKIDDAIECLLKITGRSNSNQTDMETFEDVYYLLGYCYARKGDFQKQIAAFQKVISINPEHRFVYGAMGNLFRILGRYKDAFSLFDKQMQLNPMSQSYAERALLYQAVGDTRNAISDFQCAIQLDNSNTFAYSRLGLLYESQGNFAEAEEAYKGALAALEPEENKERAEMTLFLARLYQCNNEFYESKAMYTSYLDNYAFNADVAYDYSVLLMRMGDFNGAVGILKQAISSGDNASDVQMCIRRLIEVYGEAGYVDLAHEAYEYAMEKNPHDARACGIMGDIFFANQLYDDAKTVYEQAIKLDIDNKENYYSNLMECIVRRKRIYNISKYVPSATIPKKYMRSPRQYIKMARLYRVTKNYSEALSVIKVGLKIRRCKGCFYGKCHRALFEMAKIYEAMREYGMTRRMYEEALHVCGYNAFYEACLKRIQDKK